MRRKILVTRQRRLHYDHLCPSRTLRKRRGTCCRNERGRARLAIGRNHVVKARLRRIDEIGLPMAKFPKSVAKVRHVVHVAEQAPRGDIAQGRYHTFVPRNVAHVALSVFAVLVVPHRVAQLARNQRVVVVVLKRAVKHAGDSKPRPLGVQLEVVVFATPAPKVVRKAVASAHRALRCEQRAAEKGARLPVRRVYRGGRKMQQVALAWKRVRERARSVTFGAERPQVDVVGGNIVAAELCKRDCRAEIEQPAAVETQV
mmetsp:Transcript_9415/g.25059  ORF Transcript_9415/g.25059 Transcript_9415/m.25059 type:complete len:258 (-) Transcript_9415:80-853(-)